MNWNLGSFWTEFYFTVFVLITGEGYREDIIRTWWYKWCGWNHHCNSFDTSLGCHSTDYILWHSLFLWHSLLLMIFLIFWYWVQVEGEIDKLSLEEAGLCNCVSVPNGAPTKVSTKGLPSVQKVCANTKAFWGHFKFLTFVMGKLCLFSFLNNLIMFV